MQSAVMWRTRGSLSLGSNCAWCSRPGRCRRKTSQIPLRRSRARVPPVRRIGSSHTPDSSNGGTLSDTKNRRRVGAPVQDRALRGASFLHENSPGDGDWQSWLDCRPSWEDCSRCTNTAVSSRVGTSVHECPGRICCAVADRDGAASPLGKGKKTSGPGSANWLGRTPSNTARTVARACETNRRASDCFRGCGCVPNLGNSGVANSSPSSAGALIPSRCFWAAAPSRQPTARPAMAMRVRRAVMHRPRCQETIPRCRSRRFRPKHRRETPAPRHTAGMRSPPPSRHGHRTIVSDCAMRTSGRLRFPLPRSLRAGRRQR